ncbi:UDP-N-acetyl-D-mannosaminouronate:lipid I N-acetyl-D-mannosaminouronosyltransferase [Aquiflexum balticum DSM 16537]|uniref:UDP-N-acetyl-D-mannosaminouronate:lipid I N-acetyl-D-mannosaminouronosyltransferase n=1 Tax=Aquiflexum balticum DSM 16537 TaxID=758820 RepID=A0A1W2H6P7_9BACT|nr:WecB/TagA/CpsF family glycosyltransferase [Aquiflexum balticum]SMD44630.1 UDP-N-acetyl-D-mannosaminouronate:lipid I N-acetyl-D-mannosaminouronosyltransferase [Aquiflexum balticum DSM 16537]
MNKETINGIEIYAPRNRNELIQFALEEKKILIAVNAEKILHSTEQTRSIINRNLGYPDGIGAVWALKSKGFKDVVKIPGCELWLDIINEKHHSQSFYLIGGTEDTIHKTVALLKLNFPNINILNFRNGYIKSVEEKEFLFQDIKEKKPDIIFVAMGSPRQELLMEEIYQIHPALYQGLGGSFDVYTGAIKRAPEWWIKNNIEWAFRLINQPKRIFRQIHLIKFYWKLKLKRL